MAASTPTRIGQVNGAGDVDALFLKMYAGMVLAAYARKNQFESRAYVKSVSAGKSASFPAIGRSSATYHAVGTELTGNTIPQNEVVITADGQLVAHTFIAEWDELVNHFEVQSTFAAEQGRARQRRQTSAGQPEDVMDTLLGAYLGSTGDQAKIPLAQPEPEVAATQKWQQGVERVLSSCYRFSNLIYS